MLYSGWRRKRGLGFSVFSQKETITLIVMAFILAVTAGQNPRTLWFTLPIFCITLLGFIRYGGMAGWDIVRREIGWRWAAARGYLEYQSGLISSNSLIEMSDRLELPGLLAPTRLLGMRDGLREWGIVWDQSTDFLTTTFLCNSQSPMLVDEDSFNVWVAQWHHWLAALGAEPQIEFITVTVESAREGGATVTENIRQSLVPTAPTHSYDVVTSLTSLGTDQSAFIETRVSITFNPNNGPAKKRTIDERVAEISRLLYGLQSRLSNCGLSGVRRASPAELSANMRIAFDPGSRDVVTDAMIKGARPLRWSQAGPVNTKETRNYYMHDTGTSVSWAWTGGPRSPVPATILSNMVNPGPYPKRVCLLYEPSDPAAISRQLEQERTALEAKRILIRQSQNNESERARVDREFAAMAAQEEARGAGFGDMSFYVTVTVPNVELVDDAVTDIASRSAQSKLQLRRATCSHAALFATGLGAGIHPAYKSNKGWF